MLQSPEPFPRHSGRSERNSSALIDFEWIVLLLLLLLLLQHHLHLPLAEGGHKISSTDDLLFRNQSLGVWGNFRRFHCNFHPPTLKEIQLESITIAEAQLTSSFRVMDDRYCPH